MKLHLQRVPRGLRWPPSTIGALLVFAVLVMATHAIAEYTHRPITLCWLKAATGVPCPACGSTRAAVALACGRVAHAFSLNPLATILLPLIALWLAAHTLLGRALTLRATRVEWFALAALGVLALAANWWYVFVNRI